MRRKKSKNHFFRNAVLLLVVCACAGLFYAYRQEKSAHPEESWQEAAQKTITDTVEKGKELTPEGKDSEDKDKKATEKTDVTKKQPSSPAFGRDWLPGLSKRQYKGKLAVVIDDCGYDMDALSTLTRLPLPMSFAIIPFKTHSRDALQEIRSQGRVAMLHLPMEPMSGGSSEAEAVKVGMTKEQIQRFTQKAIDSLPGIQGVNNHQGSKATSNGPTITSALTIMKQNGLFFVDSRTSSSTVAEEKAAALGMRTGHNSLFLDNSADEETIRRQIGKAIALADQYGSLIVICHARPHTAAAWKKSVAAIQATGIRLVPVTDVL